MTAHRLRLSTVVRTALPLAVALLLLGAVPAALAVAPPRAASEAQAKRVASRYAQTRYGISFPAAVWFARCTTGRNFRGCAVSSNDAPKVPGARPDRCDGTLRIYGRPGHFRTRRLQIVCRGDDGDIIDP